MEQMLSLFHSMDNKTEADGGEFAPSYYYSLALRDHTFHQYPVLPLK